MRPVAVLRPEPGNAATAARIEALGLDAIRLPLFAVAPVAWDCPDPAAHDAVLLTSANAVRHGGAGLERLHALPVFAVGAATARAARDAGFDVALTGNADAAALLAAAKASGVTRGLHLGGRERTVMVGGPVSAAITVYASDAVPEVDLAPLQGSVALLHSARAARRLAALAVDRGDIRLAVLSEALVVAAGSGWDRIAVAGAPDDQALLAAACALAD